MDIKDEEPNSAISDDPPSSRSWYVFARTCFLALVIIWATRSFSEPGGVLHGVRIWSRPYMSAPPSNMASRYDEDCDLHNPDEAPLPAVRTEFGSLATIVYGWPSTGGVWVHEDCYGVELNFLGLSRFEPSDTERYSEDEDKFCKRLELIGARFYKSEYAYNSQRSQFRKSQLWVGWPSVIPEGGVWALWTRDPEGAEIGVSRAKNALTMEERCKAIEMLGGKFYEKWESVPKDASQTEA